MRRSVGILRPRGSAICINKFNILTIIERWYGKRFKNLESFKEICHFDQNKYNRIYIINYQMIFSNQIACMLMRTHFVIWSLGDAALSVWYNRGESILTTPTSQNFSTFCLCNLDYTLNCLPDIVLFSPRTSQCCEIYCF